MLTRILAMQKLFIYYFFVINNKKPRILLSNIVFVIAVGVMPMLNLIDNSIFLVWIIIVLSLIYLFALRKENPMIAFSLIPITKEFFIFSISAVFIKIVLFFMIILTLGFFYHTGVFLLINLIDKTEPLVSIDFGIVLFFIRQFLFIFLIGFPIFMILVTVYLLKNKWLKTILVLILTSAIYWLIILLDKNITFIPAFEGESLAIMYRLYRIYGVFPVIGVTLVICIFVVIICYFILLKSKTINLFTE